MHIKTICLGILAFGDATGYEIKKMSEEGRFRHFIDASFGYIYPALTKLTQDGLVGCRQEQQDGKPDRKIYSITPDGLRAFIAGLDEEPADDKFKSEFLFIMLCAEFSNPARITQAIDSYADVLTAKIDVLVEAKETCDHASSQFCIGYGLAVYRAALDYVTRNKDAAIALSSQTSSTLQAAL